jgi:hypothetical protein
MLHRSDALTYLSLSIVKPYTLVQQQDWKRSEASTAQRHRRIPMPAMPFSVSVEAHSAPSKQHKRNLFLRIVDAIGETNRRRAEREIALFLARHGGRFPDSVDQPTVEHPYDR